MRSCGAARPTCLGAWRFRVMQRSFAKGWWGYARAIRRKGWLSYPGRIAGLFVAGYGAARFVVEFFRQPDAQFVTEGNPLGLAWQVGGVGLTMGQALSLPMIAVGLWFIVRARRA